VVIKESGGYDNPNLIHLDAGGFSNFFSSSGRVKTEALIELHDTMQVDAVNITARELAGDAAQFIAAIDGKQTPYISANIINENSGKAHFSSHVTITTGQGDVAVVGIAAAAAKTWPLGEDALLISDPKAALEELLPTIAAKTIILITDLPRAKLQRLLEEVHGIDLVLGADGYSITQQQLTMAGVPVSYAGKQGQYLATMQLDLSGEKLAVKDHKLLHLNSDFPEDKNVRAVVDAALAKVAESEEAERSKLSGLMEQVTDKYTGYFACGSCHKEQIKQWRSTDHVSALHSLQSGKRKPDNTCLPCHTVGFGDGGFVDIRVTGYLSNVQCESCHGPGRDHVADPNNVPMPDEVTPNTCAKCHDIANSPEFDYQKFREIVAH
jgi:hypothetical protein